MRNLLIILKLMGLMVIFAQVPDSTKTTNNLLKTNPPETIEKEIQQLAKENAKQLEEVKNLKLKNQIALGEVRKIDEKKKSLKSQIIKRIDEILTRSPRKVIRPQVIYVKTSDDKSPSRIDIRNLKLDSSCLSYKRDGILDKKKCTEWEYFKVIEGDKLKIK